MSAVAVVVDIAHTNHNTKKVIKKLKKDHMEITINKKVTEYIKSNIVDVSVPYITLDGNFWKKVKNYLTEV